MVSDLEAPIHCCEMCESKFVRYVHTMRHPNHPELDVGCICAGHMEGNKFAARQREQDFKQRSARKSKWLSRAWFLSRSGNEYLNVDGFNIVIYYQRGGYWSARIKHRETGYQKFSQRRYATAEQAKLAAFDAMQILKDSPEIERLQQQIAEQRQVLFGYYLE
jgi:hypothetical protein